MQDHWCTPGAFSIPPRDLDPGKAQLPLLQKLPAVVGQLSLTLHLPGLSSAVGLLPRPAVDDRIAQAQAAAVPRVRRRAADVPDLPPGTPGAGYQPKGSRARSLPLISFLALSGCCSFVPL